MSEVQEVRTKDKWNDPCSACNGDGFSEDEDFAGMSLVAPKLKPCPECDGYGCVEEMVRVKKELATLTHES